MANQLPSRFRIVLHSVDSNWTSRVQAELARLFQVEDRIASSIVSSAPIVVFDDLEVAVAVEIRKRMQTLVDAGCVFVMTDEASDEVPRINWPDMPEFAKQSMEQAQSLTPEASAEAPPAEKSGPTNHHLMHRFDCPSCGEHFALYRLSDEAAASLPQAQPQPQAEKIAPRPEPKPEPKTIKRPTPPPPPPAKPPEPQPQPNSVQFDDPLLKAHRASRQASSQNELTSSQRLNMNRPQSPSTRFSRDKTKAEDDFKMPEIDDEPFPDSPLFDSREEKVVNANLFDSEPEIRTANFDESGEFSFDPMDDDSGEPTGLFDNAPAKLETEGPQFSGTESIVEENIFDSSSGDDDDFLFDSKTDFDPLEDKPQDANFSAAEMDAMVHTSPSAPESGNFAPPPGPQNESPADDFAAPLTAKTDFVDVGKKSDSFEVSFDESFDGKFPNKPVAEELKETRPDINRDDDPLPMGESLFEPAQSDAAFGGESNDFFGEDSGDEFGSDDGFGSGDNFGSGEGFGADDDLFGGDDDALFGSDDDDLFGEGASPPSPQNFKETRPDDLFAPKELRDRELKRQQFRDEISNVLDGSQDSSGLNQGSPTQDDLNDLGLGSRRRKSDFSQRSDSELRLAFAEDKVEPASPAVAPEPEKEIVASGFAFADDDDDDDFSDFDSVTEMSRSGEFLRSQEDATPVHGFTRGMPFEKAIRLFDDSDLTPVDDGEGLITESTPAPAKKTADSRSVTTQKSVSKPLTQRPPTRQNRRPAEDDFLPDEPSDPFGLTSEMDSTMAVMEPPPPPSRTDARDPFDAPKRKPTATPAAKGEVGETSTSGEDLRKLDFNETYAMLGDDKSVRRQRRSGRLKQRGLLPMPATDEDFSLVGDNKPREAKSTRYKRAELLGDGQKAGRRTSTGGIDLSKMDKSDPFESMPGGSLESSRLPGSQSDSTRVRPVPEKPSGAETNPGEYSLVLSKIDSDAKKQEAARLISQIQGSQLKDAIRLTERTIIPVLKNVTKEDAEKHLESFRVKDISGRVTRRRGAQSRR